MFQIVSKGLKWSRMTQHVSNDTKWPLRASWYHQCPCFCVEISTHSMFVPMLSICWDLVWTNFKHDLTCLGCSLSGGSIQILFSFVKASQINILYQELKCSPNYQKFAIFGSTLIIKMKKKETNILSHTKDRDSNVHIFIETLNGGLWLILQK